MKPGAHEAVAIVGMSCAFPGAPDLASFAANLREGRDAVTEVPASRWEPVFHDPGADAPDRFYCRRGGFLPDDLRVDAAAAGLMPVAAEGAEPDQLLAFEHARRALADAGHDERRPAPSDTAVVLGRGGYLGAGLARVEQHARTAQQLVECLRGLLPQLGAEQLEAVRAEFRSRLRHFGPDTAIGLVPNLAASRIANRLDFHGAAYTVDAACASSLLAVDQACHELASGRAELALAGAVHLCHDVTLWSVFTQLGALSRSERSRPFDRRADGLLIGEGVGLLVLKRLADAERDGDRIYAVLRGLGVSSDGRGASLMQPRVEGQLLALERAWSAAGLEPASVGLLEAHGTATPAGDAAELTTLGRFFGAELPGRPVLGSVKSMIGHAMPAAGAAGLIKAALAIHEGLLPPTLHCEEPHALLESTAFRVIPAAEPWEDDLRRAGVSAFGFGGINAHAVLESPSGSASGRRVAVSAPEPAAAWPELLLLAAEDAGALARALEEGRGGGGAGPARLALVDPSPERRARALEIVREGRARRSEREGVWFTPRGLAGAGGRVAFLFPGIDAGFDPRVDEVADHFGLARPPAFEAERITETGQAVVAVNDLLHAALAELGVSPDLIAGHSIGEWSGMVAAGMVTRETMEGFVRSRAGSGLELPGVVFAAAGCGAERAREALEGLDEISISHDNCPHQVILCGREDSVAEAKARLLAGGRLCQQLPFRSGFHSPAYRDYVEPHRATLESLEISPARVPLWSATTCRPYPDEPDEIRALALEHLVRPVRFRELVLALHDAGARVFVEVGSGRLAGFVADILREREHALVRSNVASRSGLEQLGRAAAQLWVEGLPVDLATAGLEGAPGEAGLALRLGQPLVSMEGCSQLLPPGRSGEDELERAARESGDPLLAALGENLQAIRAAQDEILAAWRAARGPSSRPTPRELRRELELSTAAQPYLLDHCFYRQPEGWPVKADRFPVLPLTTSIELMRRFAAELVPEGRAVAVERVRAYRWTPVEPAVRVELHACFDGVDRVEVALGEQASAVVRFAESWPAEEPEPLPALREAGPAPVAAEQLYEQRWMFHGPSFRGVRGLGPVSPQGIDGRLEASATPGALLDNAGQLFGYWVMMSTPRDRLAFPAKIDRLEYFGPEPAEGSLLDCRVRILELDEQRVRADLELRHEGRTWVRIRGWEDRRFESDERLWEVLRFPETEVFTQPRDGGWCLIREAWRRPASRDLIARRYLGQGEHARYEAMGPERRGWLLARIAAKDAVRAFLFERGCGPVFPIEVELRDESPAGCWSVGGAGGGLRVAAAAEGEFAVALVGEGGGLGVGLAPLGPGGSEDAAREAAARAALEMAGAGRGRAPRREGSRFTAGALVADSAVEDGFAVAWTVGGSGHE